MRRILHSLYEYLALGFGLGLLGTISLTWTLFAVPLHLVLPRRVAHRLGRWVITMGFASILAHWQRSAPAVSTCVRSTNSVVPAQ